MSGIIMFILFLLNILTLFAVVVLFLRQNRLIQVEKDQKTVLSEMEELMTGYIMEMKEENEVLLKQLVEKKNPSIHHEGEQTVSLHPEPAGFIESASGFVEQNRVSLLHSKKNIAVEAYKSQSPAQQEMKEADSDRSNDLLELSTASEKPSLETANDSVKTSFSETLQASLNGYSVPEPSLYEQVIALTEQGLFVEEIAQTLKRGKTEIELLLKFQSGKKDST